MIEQKALVRDVFHNGVELEYELNSSCSGCVSEDSCGVGTVAKAFNGKTQRIKVSTNQILNVGQWVTIATKEANVLVASAVTYLLPLLGLLLGSIVGQKWLVDTLALANYSAILFGISCGVLSQQLGKFWLRKNSHLSPSTIIVAPHYS